MQVEPPACFNVSEALASIYLLIPEKPIRDFRDGDAFDLKPIEGTRINFRLEGMRRSTPISASAKLALIDAL
jgi:hypothetical protein